MALLKFVFPVVEDLEEEEEEEEEEEDDVAEAETAWVRKPKGQQQQQQRAARPRGMPRGISRCAEMHFLRTAFACLLSTT